jgi:hypothetical protein
LQGGGISAEISEKTRRTPSRRPSLEMQSENFFSLLLGNYRRQPIRLFLSFTQQVVQISRKLLK